MSGNDYSQWFSGKTFSTDWSSPHFPTWESLLRGRRNETLKVLEIGSWEGRSAVFFLAFFRNGHVTCVDTFEGSVEHHAKEKWSAALPQIEARFDSNLAEFSGRFEKIKLPSYRALPALKMAGRSFDVIHVDGSHHSDDAYSDASESWPMLESGGLMIFDDYEWTFFDEPDRTPKQGIDRFLREHVDEYRELHRGYQVIIQRLGRSVK
jgi:predicted O-methyltransferase YrrM